MNKKNGCTLLLIALMLSLFASLPVHAQEKRIVRVTGPVNTYIFPRLNSSKNGSIQGVIQTELIEYGPEFSYIYGSDNETDWQSGGYIETKYLEFPSAPPADYDPDDAYAKWLTERMLTEGWIAHGLLDGNGEMITLFKTPEDSAETLGQYFTGVRIDVLSIIKDWAHVYVGESYFEEGQEGYIPLKFISMFADGYTAPSDIPVMRVVADSPSTQVAMLDAPKEGANARGHFLPGSLLEVIGMSDTHYYIRHFNLYGYIAKSQLEETGKISHFDQFVYSCGMPPKGYIAYQSVESVENGAATCYPYTLPEDISYSYPATEKALENIAYPSLWIADTEGYVQAGNFYNDGGSYGFFPSAGLRYYAFGEEIAPITEKGSYQIGADIPEGFFTFDAADTTEGTLRIASSDGAFEKEHSIHAGGSYSMFLPEGASLTIDADGVLTTLKRELVAKPENYYTITQDGRYLIGEQFPGAPECPFYYVRPVEGATTGSYTLSPVTAEDKEVDDFMILTDTVTEKTMIDTPAIHGFFIELHNLELICEFGNG